MGQEACRQEDQGWIIRFRQVQGYGCQEAKEQNHRPEDEGAQGINSTMINNV